jgi:hypothetical protein
MRRAICLLAAACAASAAAPSSSAPLEIFVDPVRGSDIAALLNPQRGTRAAPLRTVHAARDAVREALRGGKHVTVQLMPGLHHVGDRPLALGAADGGGDGDFVTWRSWKPELPATVGAPVRITGWKAHPTIQGAMIAPLPSNITKGSALRQLWVGGQRALRTRVYGHGRQQGDNRMGYCHNCEWRVTPARELPVCSWLAPRLSV